MSEERHLPANPLLEKPWEHNHEQHIFHNPPNTAGHARLKFKKNCPVALGAPPAEQPQVVMEAPASVPSVSAQQGHEVLILEPAQAKTEPLTRTSQWKKREREEAQGKASLKRRYTRKVEYNLCKKCGQPRIKLNGHSQFKGKIYCPSFETSTRDEWLAQIKQQS